MAMKRRWAIGCLAWLAGCGGVWPTGTTAGWLADLPRMDAARCPAQAASTGIARRVQVRAFRGPEVTEADVRGQLRRMAAYWKPWAVEIDLSHRVETLPEPHLLGGDPELEADSAALDSTFVTLRDFVRREAMPARDQVLVVVHKRITRKGSLADRALPELAGLTFSPDLETSPDAPFTQAEALGTSGAFTPVVLLGLDELRNVRPDTVDVVAAHELGHALGLGHSDVPGTLMFPERPSCLPVLLPEHAARLRQRDGDG